MKANIKTQIIISPSRYDDSAFAGNSGYYMVKCSRCINPGSAQHEIPISATYKLMYVPYFPLLMNLNRQVNSKFNELG